jgi:hypothetical protein
VRFIRDLLQGVASMHGTVAEVTKEPGTGRGGDPDGGTSC